MNIIEDIGMINITSGAVKIDEVLAQSIGIKCSGNCILCFQVSTMETRGVRAESLRGKHR